MTPSNKPRLYVALYARGGEPDTYHWALIAAPKKETDETKAKRYHVRQRMYTEDGRSWNQWEYEELDITTLATRMILVRIMVAKILNWPKLEEVVRAVPIVQNDKSWTCRIWVRNAMASLAAEAGVLGRSVTDWPTIESSAKQYARKKKDQHRFDGEGDWDMSKVPTWDLIENKETIV